jgi:hypothetical protein
MLKDLPKFGAAVLLVATMVLASNAFAPNRHTFSHGLVVVSPEELWGPTSCLPGTFTTYYNEVNNMIKSSLGITVWLVKDVEAFQNRVFSDNFGPSSELDRALRIDILYREWDALLFDVLKANRESYRNWAQEWDSGETGDMFLVPEYPMLSRINDHLVDVTYSQA